MTPSSLGELGFYFGTSGAHAGRALMLADLVVLLEHAPASADNGWFSRAILDDNLLSKASVNNRDHANRRMRQLYALDSNTCLYRVFRNLFLADGSSKAALAVLMAMSRDALFRESSKVILATPIGKSLTAEAFLPVLDAVAAGRMGEKTLRHACGNVFNSWSQAGYLTETKPRQRVKPGIGWSAVAFALFLGWLEGERGRLLFDTQWAKALDKDFDELLRLASIASRQGYLELLNAGGVIEVRFPGYLTPEEEKLP